MTDPTPAGLTTDLMALAARVESILDRHGVPEGKRHCAVVGNTYLLMGESTSWTARFQTAQPFYDLQDERHEQPARLEYSGDLTPASLDVLSAVWSSVGQDEETRP